MSASFARAHYDSQELSKMSMIENSDGYEEQQTGTLIMTATNNWDGNQEENAGVLAMSTTNNREEDLEQEHANVSISIADDSEGNQEQEPTDLDISVADDWEENHEPEPADLAITLTYDWAEQKTADFAVSPADGVNDCQDQKTASPMMMMDNHWDRTLYGWKKNRLCFKKYACQLCGKRFITSSHLHRHHRVHTGEKPFRCATCGKEFARKHSLQGHKSNCKEANGEKMMLEDKHNSNNSNQQAKKQKTKIPQKEKRKSLACQYCNKVFPCNSKLLRHTRVHTRETPYQQMDKSKFRKCQYCYKAFPSNSKLLRHIQTHTREKPILKCQFCNKVFPCNSKLLRHTQTHTRDKPINPIALRRAKTLWSFGPSQCHRVKQPAERKILKCQFCNKVFPCNSKLLRHTQTHTRENPNQQPAKEDTKILVKEIPKILKCYQLTQPHTGEKPTQETPTLEKESYTQLHTRENPNQPTQTYTGDKPKPVEQESQTLEKETYYTQLHTGEKPNQPMGEETIQPIKEEPKSLNEESYTDLHKVEKKEEKAFFCPLCNKSFARKDSVKRHFLHVHDFPSTKSDSFDT